MIAAALMERHPLERHPLRRRSIVGPPPANPSARAYCIREVGVLAEQGVLDRARALLAKRAQSEPRAPEAFLDAIRLELGVPTSGSAFRAWLERALEGGVEIADRIASIVPEQKLASALIEIPPSALLQQASRAQALDLLRLRASALLTAGDPRALDVLAGELVAAGARDRELRELQVAVLLARAFTAPEPVERYRLELIKVLEPERAEALRSEIELAQAYHAAGLVGRLPVVDAALALLERCDDETDRALRANLGRDLRARPSDHVAWADAVAAAGVELLELLLARLRRCRPSELGSGPQATTLTAELAQAVERDALRFVPLPASELALYRKHVRPKAARAIAERGASFEALATACREHKGAGRRALAHLESDAALKLLHEVASNAA